jgi:hypothetical protein
MRMSVVKDVAGNGFPLVQEDTVYEMTASSRSGGYFLPNYHPMGVSCL